MALDQRYYDQYQDTYFFYTAEIIDVPTIEDVRLKVRVLPHMIGIDDTLLPKWPSFFREEVFGGYAKKDKVWVVALPDFSTGWILGKANNTSFDNDSYTNPITDFIQSISDKILNFGGIGSLDASKIRVTFFADDIIEFYETNLKLKVSINSNGNMICMSDKLLALNFKGTKTASYIQLDESGITLSGPKLNIDVLDVKFKGMDYPLCGILSPLEGPVSSISGITLFPLKRIRA